MAEEKNNSATYDTFEAFQKMRDSYLESMSKVMINAVNSEEYARATGAMLGNSLAMATPLREALDKMMLMALEQFSLPSRQQVTALAERFTNVEMRLDDLDAKLDRIADRLSRTNTSAATAPPSSRRPVPGDAQVSHQARSAKS